MQFKHPDIKEGSISVGNESIPVRKGIVDVPEKLGREMGWAPVGGASADSAKVKSTERASVKKAPAKSSGKKRK